MLLPRVQLTQLVDPSIVLQQQALGIHTLELVHPLRRFFGDSLLGNVLLLPLVPQFIVVEIATQVS